MRGLSVAAIFISAGFGAAIANAGAGVEIVVFDFAKLPPGILASAARQSSRAFHDAGIETAWTLCNAGESCHVPTAYLPVKILRKPLPTTPVSPHGLGYTLNCAPVDGCSTSFIFYDRILEFADRTISSNDLTLGCVLAHEIGHLLGLGHTPHSVMSASFTADDLHRAALGWLSFANGDARELRSTWTPAGIAGTPKHHPFARSRAQTAE